jgi:hypothetical protein
MTCTVPQNLYAVPAQFYNMIWQSRLALWSLPWAMARHSANLLTQPQRGNVPVST